MQEGSIVIMVKPMDELLYKAMTKAIGQPPPIPSETIQHMVTGMGKEKTNKGLRYPEESIFLDTYPKYEKEELPFDATLFVELLPPEMNVEALFEKNEKRVPELVT